MVNEHMPERPSWDCRACGKPFPCDPAREALAVEYAGNGVALSMLLWSYLEDFAVDSGPGPLGEAYERFVGWRPTAASGERLVQASEDPTDLHLHRG